MAECLAIYWAINHWHTYLYGGLPFKVFTDHRPAEFWNNDNIQTKNRTVEDLRQRLTGYSFTVKYKPGKEMGAPDFLSRIYETEVAEIRTNLDKEDRRIIDAIDDALEGDLPTPCDDLGCPPSEMKKHQLAEPDIRDTIRYLTGENPSKNTAIIKQHGTQDLHLVQGVLYHERDDRLRLVTPKVFVPKILEKAHDSKLGGHRSFDKTLDRIKKSFVWLTMTKDIRNYILRCHNCQLSRRPNKNTTRTPLQPLPPAVKANERVHIDLMGPLKSVTENKYIMVITDAFSKYVVLAAIPDKSAQTVAKAFFKHWVGTFTTPDFLITDNGREFDNKVIKQLTKELEIGHIKTTAYHPQTNAQCERFNRTLLGYLRNFVEKDTLNWEECLLHAQISYNTQIHSSTGQCPHFLMFLEDPNLPFSTLTKRTLDDAWPQTELNKLHKTFLAVGDAMKNSMEAQKAYYDRKTKNKDFAKGDLILKLRQTHTASQNRKLLPIWTGPYAVTKVNKDTKQALLKGQPNKPAISATFDQLVHYHARAPYDYKTGFLCREKTRW